MSKFADHSSMSLVCHPSQIIYAGPTEFRISSSKSFAKLPTTSCMSEISNLAVNPYAPPAVTEPSAVIHEQWKIAENALWIQNEARIPGVDLLTGELTPEGAAHRKMTFQLPSWQAIGSGIVCILIMSGVKAAGRYWGLKIPAYSPMLTALVVSFGISRFIKRGSNPGIFRLLYSETVARSRKRKMRRAGFSACAIVVGTCVLSLPYLPTTLSSRALMGVIAAFIIILILSVIAMFASRQLRAGDHSGIWLQLKGVHPDALLHLASLPQPERLELSLDYQRYRIHLEKFSLRSWCHVLKWKLGPCLRVALSKCLGKEIIIHALLPLRPSRSDPASISESFKNQVLAEQGKLPPGEWLDPSWLSYYAPNLIPTFIESVSFLHRDHQSLLSFTLSANEKASIFSTSLISWLENGEVIYSSNERTFAIMNPSVQWLNEPEMAPTTLIAKHLQRCVEEDVITLENEEDALQRLIHLSRANYQWLHARKIYGPLEDFYA